MKPLAAAALALATLAATPAAAMDPNCWFNGSSPLIWPPATKVEVYLDISPDCYVPSCGEQYCPTVCGVQAAGYDPLDFALAMQTAIAQWNEETNTPLRLSYIGGINTSLTGQDHINGAIIVRAIPGCTNSLLATAAPIDANDDGTIDRGHISMYVYQRDDADVCQPLNPQSPMGLVDLLVHEFGHTLGRADAYMLSNPGQLNACGLAHDTLMSSDFQRDQTAFDRREHQAVYGSRVSGTTIKRRTYGSSWGAVTSISDSAVVGPAPGSSFGLGTIVVPIVRISGSSQYLRRRFFAHAETWGTTYAQTITPTIRNPVSVSVAPDGSAIQAYMSPSAADGEDTGSLQLCYAFSTNSGASFAAATCLFAGDLGGGSHSRTDVATAYDPLSGQFMVAWTKGTLNLKTFNRPGRTGRTSQVAIAGVSGAGAAIACADSQPVNVPLHTNCRLVFPDTSRAGQPLSWIEFGVGFLNALSIGTRYDTYIYSEHPPAVTWYAGYFHLAYSRFDRYVYHYRMSRAATAWSYVTALNSTGWVSPPMLSPTRTCSGSTCTDKLHVFWLSYPDPL